MYLSGTKITKDGHKKTKMNARKISIMAVATTVIYTGAYDLGRSGQTGSAAIINLSIPFDDIAPAGLTLEQCWNAMGMDHQERVYIGFTSRRSDGREDFAVFR